jgi:lysozyme
VTTPLLISDLKRDEGFRARAYRDSKGIWTVGYGHAYVQPGEVWTEDKASAQLAVDVDLTCGQLDKALPWWRGLDLVRQDALANMAFNIGVGVPPCAAHPEGGGVQEFQHMLEALRSNDWPHASVQALMSRWAKEPPEGVGQRAERIAYMFKTGKRA